MDSGVNDTCPSPPMHAWAMAWPAARPPMAAMPASMTRAPHWRVCTATRSSSARSAMRSAMSAARALRPRSDTTTPCENLSSAHGSGIARVATIRAVDETRVDAYAVASCHVRQREPDVRRVIGTRIRIRRRHVALAADHERAALASRRRLCADAAEDNHRAGNDGACGAVAGIPAYEYQAAPHARAGLGADGPGGHDLAAHHAARSAGGGRPNAVAGGAT